MVKSAANRGRFRDIAIWIACAFIGYISIVMFVDPLGALIIKKYPGNFEWQIAQAMKNDNFSAAVKIASARVKQEYYDFRARRLLAEALVADGKAAQAVDIMLNSLSRASAVRGRDVFSLGYDIGADYTLLAKALQSSGQTAFADEMLRAAADASASIMVLDQSGETTSSRQMSNHIEQEIDQTLDLTSFNLTTGALLSKDGSLQFSTRSSASVNLPTRDQISSSLCLLVRGRKVMGFGSMLKIMCDDSEIFRVYADTESPRWVQAPIPASVAGENIKLTLQFLNDAFDPVSKADRNIEIKRVGLCGAI